jgi:subtilisin
MAKLRMPTALEHVGGNAMGVTTEVVTRYLEPRRIKVAPLLEREVTARGVAQAIVFLEPPRETAALVMAIDDMAEIEQCFVKDERSLSAALGLGGAASLGLAVSPRRKGKKLSVYATARDRSYHQKPVMRQFDALGVVLGDVHKDGLDQLTRNPRVKYVGTSLNVSLIRPIDTTDAKLTASTTWGIERLRVPHLWQAGYTGEGVRVGHLDTGVDGTHPALRAAVKGFLFTDADGFEVPGVAPFDTDAHGTHTAGTICGRAVNGKFIGVAPDAGLYSAAVIEGGNVVARILAGLDWVVRQQVKIVSISLGLRGWEDSFLELMIALRDRGILPVVAVGNEGPGTSRSPGNYPNVLSVGAISEANGVPDFSSSDMFSTPTTRIVPDLVAPGVAVVSAKAGGGYAQSRGTSMATPHIAGLAACLWQAKPNATADEIEMAIERSCTLGNLPQERANLGVPDAVVAYERLMGTPLPAAAGTAGARPKRKAKKAVAKRRPTTMKSKAPKAKRSGRSVR